MQHLTVRSELGETPSACLCSCLQLQMHTPLVTAAHKHEQCNYSHKITCLGDSLKKSASYNLLDVQKDGIQRTLR